MEHYDHTISALICMKFSELDRLSAEIYLPAYIKMDIDTDALFPLLSPVPR